MKFVPAHSITIPQATQSVLFSNPTNFDQSRDMNKCRYGAARVPEPDVLAEEIIEKLEAGLNSFRTVLSSLRKGA
jgi:type I restriction enzyme M protein